MPPPSLHGSPRSRRLCLFPLTGSSLNTEAVPSCSWTISPRTEAMCPPSGQSLPQTGDRWYLLSLCLCPGTCHGSGGGPWGHCTHSPHIPVHLGHPPSRPAWSGLEAVPDVPWPTPLSLAKAPGRWGAGGTLTSGAAFSVLGERTSTLWMRPSLLVAGGGGREGQLPLSLRAGGRSGRNQGRISEALMFKATIPRG